MHSPRLLLLGLSALLAAPTVALAQVSFGGVPAAEWAELSPLVPTRTTEVPDVARLMAEDEARNHRPLRYGELVDAELDLMNAGAWDITPDGTKVWRQRFLAPGALSVALEFTRFDLPEGVQMFVYDDDRSQLMGAFTSANHQENGGFVFAPLRGDNLTLELVQPAFVQDDPVLTVDKLIYDYRDLFELERRLEVGGGGTAEGSCTVDVNCAEGDDYGLQQRATMRTLSGGGLCSAALVNNTSGDGTQYVLTADHCGQSSNTVFRFNYKTAGCGTGGAPTNQQVSGATLLTTSGTYDCRLMRINGNIPDNYEPYFAGWTRSSFNTTKAAALGHPGGGPMTVSIDNNGTAKDTTLWRVFWNVGMLEGGNSGGPLIDVNGRVKGPACCVSNFDCGQQTAWFGRFDRFYDTNNLAQWLDPAGTDPQTVDGLDPFGGGGGNPDSPPVIASVSPASVQALVATSNQSVTLTGTDFTGMTEVKVNGQVLEVLPPEWILVNDTTLTVSIQPQDTLGPIDIEITNAFGSATTQLTIEPVTAPVVDLLGSDPGFLISAVGLTIRSASEVNDLVYTIGSLSNVPTVLPGLVSLDLGNNGLALNTLSIGNVDSAKGWNETQVPLAGLGLPAGTKIYVQLAVISALSPTLPALTSNLESGTILF